MGCESLGLDEQQQGFLRPTRPFLPRTHLTADYSHVRLDGCEWVVGGQRALSLRQGVEEGGLADVGHAHYCRLDGGERRAKPTRVSSGGFTEKEKGGAGIVKGASAIEEGHESE